MKRWIKRFWWWIRRKPVYWVSIDPAYGDSASIMGVYDKKTGTFTLLDKPSTGTDKIEEPPRSGDGSNLSRK